MFVLDDWLISLSIMSSRFVHGSEFPSFLRLSNTPSYVYATFCLPIHPLMGTWVVPTF